MADLVGRAKEYGGAGSRVTARQAYHVDAPSAANAKDPSVVSYHVREGMSTPYRITVEATHPEQISRADYLGRDVHFTIIDEDSSQPRIYRGLIVGLKRRSPSTAMGISKCHCPSCPTAP